MIIFIINGLIKEKKPNLLIELSIYHKLSEPVSMKELKTKYGIHPPQKLTYVSKYPQVGKDIAISEQVKIF